MGEELKTNKIYKTILNEVHNLIGTVNKETINKKLSVAHKMTGKILCEIERDIKKEYEELKKNSEWKNFTIAFYGETNAGKSTIIETLRIMLGEKTKIAEEKKIKKIIESKKISEEEKRNIIQEYSDGKIIGNGKSDYTRENMIYTFDNGKCKYKVIDVPGIEGEETQVVQSIMEAVQKAHVVFFVTRKETPPQIGDGENGILGKIKKHLGRQSEVWTIFNKSVTNTNKLKKIENKEEIRNSLKELHRVIGEQLGEQYKNEIVLSAYPAFLAVAKNIDANSSMHRQQEKFFNEYNSEEILVLTGFLEFNKILNEDIINNIEKKIIVSNQKKAMNALQKASDNIEKIKVETYESMQRAFEKNYADSVARLDRLVDKCEKNISLSSEDIIRGVLDDIKNDTYEKIESNINKSEYKSILRANIKFGIKKLESELKKMLDENVLDLKMEVDSVINETIHNYGKLVEVQEGKVDEYKIEVEFDKMIEDVMKKMESGFKWKSFIGSIFTFSLSVIMTDGFALIAGIAAAVVAAINAFFSFFSSSYRRKQQKKGVEKLIREIKPNIEKEVKEITENSKEKLEKYSEVVKTTLKEPCEEIGQHVKNLNKVMTELQHIRVMEVHHER